MAARHRHGALSSQGAFSTCVAARAGRCSGGTTSGRACWRSSKKAIRKRRPTGFGTTLA